MTGLDVLNNASMLLTKRGLAIGQALNSAGSFCTAAALVEGAKGPGKQRDKDLAYLEARRILCQSLRLPQSYDAIADWNDEFTTNKDGSRHFYRTPKEVVERIHKAMREEQERIAASTH